MNQLTLTQPPAQLLLSVLNIGSAGSQRVGDVLGFVQFQVQHCFDQVLEGRLVIDNRPNARAILILVNHRGRIGCQRLGKLIQRRLLVVFSSESSLTEIVARASSSSCDFLRSASMMSFRIAVLNTVINDPRDF